MMVVSVREDVVVVGLEPGAADLERADEAAEERARLVQRDLVPALHEPVGRGHAGDAATDDETFTSACSRSTAGCAATHAARPLGSVVGGSARRLGIVIGRCS